MSYEQSAPFYDALYTSMKNYELEAERLRVLIEESKQITGNNLLDVACGTGLHDQYLQRRYTVEGLDLSPGQLAIARQRLPEMTFYLDNMITFDFGRRYDIVTCLFSSIGHLKADELHPGIANMARHLLPGGLLLVEPWLLAHMWKPGHVSLETADLPEGGKLARMSVSTLEGRTTKLEMHYVIGLSDRETEIIVEHHDTTLFTEDEYLAAFRAAGLDAWYDGDGISNNGRGIFIGRKPTKDWTIAAMHTATPLPIQDEDGGRSISDFGS